MEKKLQPLEKKRLMIFAWVAFGVPMLMGIPMGILYNKGAGAREVLYGISAAYRKPVGDVHAAGDISGHEYAGSHESGYHLWKLDNLDPSSPGEKGDQKGCRPFLGKRKEDGNLAVGGAVFSALSAEVVFELCPDGHAGSVPDDFYGKSLSFDQSCFPAA